jgi:glutathione S-transferase
MAKVFARKCGQGVQIGRITMDYISVSEAKRLSGLRLVLTQGAPGPWSESAKAILSLKGIEYTAVAQRGGGENKELLQWTGQSSAPVAIWNEEPPRAQSLDILYLAERLNPSPQLIPDDIEQRVAMFGLIREIIGENGFAWNRRLLMFQPIMQLPAMEALMSRLAPKYGYSESAVAEAPDTCVAVLTLLAQHLKAQKNSGSDYFIGQSLTALDIYWANFASMVKPLPHKDNAMNDSMRRSYESVHPKVAAAVDPILLAHRDRMYQNHLSLPLAF